jgi:formylglycine-generating enzyme required for sulfatase activity
MPEPSRYDLFVCYADYADADRAWVEGYLFDALEKAEVRYLSEAAFDLGVPRLLEFERAIRQSQWTLLVCSPALLVDGFIQFTDLLALTYGLETGTWPVIPLILRPVELPPRLAVLIALDATDPSDHDGVIKRLCTELRRPPPPPALKLDCPYPGMAPFREADSDRFFGRDREVEELLQLLRQHSLLAVIGPSGSGKSSLVFAGLIPALRRCGLFGTGGWVIRTLRPGERPMMALAEALGDPADPARVVAKAINSEPDARRLLLVVDQFEELFTVARTDAEAFQHALRHLAETSGAYVILIARADFYPDLMVAPLWPEIQAHRGEVVPLDRGGLRRAIVRPAEAVRVFVEETLVERLVADAAGEPGVLPLVQETLVLLWERLERRFLPLRAYEALTLPHGTSGVSGGERTGLQVAMARHANKALNDLTSPQQAIARRIFLRLVQFGEGRADTRRQQTVAELDVGSDPALFQQTLDHLTARRLLTTSGDERTGRRSVDLAHEALISGWPRLQQWLGERRKAEQTRRRLEARAAEWVLRGKGSDGLLHGFALAEARRWLVSPDAEELGYTPALEDLVRESRKYQKIMRIIRSVSLVLVALAICFIPYHVYFQVAQRQAHADGLVTALETAEIREVPGLIKQLKPDLHLVRDRLRALARAGQTDPNDLRRTLHAALVLPPVDPTQVDNLLKRLRRADATNPSSLRCTLHAALALLPVDPVDRTHADYLLERLLRADASPSELLVIRQALRDHGHAPALTPKLQAKLEEKPTGLTDSQLRAAGALALFEPKDPRWPALGPRVAAKLVQQNTLQVDDWRNAFQTVVPALTPPLRQHFTDRSQPDDLRALAFTLLFEFATKALPDDPRRTEDLAELIGEANPEQFEQVLEMLQADHDRAIDLLAGKLAKPARFDDAPARRQGQIATALVRLGRAGRVWPLLKHADDPGVRTELIHDLAKFGVEPGEVIARLEAEPEVSARRALVLALGEYPADKVPADKKAQILKKLLAWYCKDPDPGVHGGIDWLLRQRWGLGADLDRLDKALAGPDFPKDRDWYVNGQGQTFAVVRGPVEFCMGSPEYETDRDDDENQHHKRIDRSFAIATKEVTVAQFLRSLERNQEVERFRKENPEGANFLDHLQCEDSHKPSADCAMAMVVNWYDAARYCNWLSQKEEIPEDQWCYPKEIRPGMTLPAKHLEREGYRLPTEAEWEYACRSGSVAARPYGHRGTEELLSKYGWYSKNAGHRMQPVGGKKPNDLGLFDVLGNAWEWVLDPYVKNYESGPEEDNPSLDTKFSDEVDRVLRGGAFDNPAADLRSASRYKERPTYHYSTIGGIRPAMTWHGSLLHSRTRHRANKLSENPPYHP